MMSEHDYSAYLQERSLGEACVDNSVRSEEDVDGVILCSPLAVIRSGESSRLELALSVDRKEGISMWVQRRVKGFGKFLSVSCAGHEGKIMELLLDIERSWKSLGKGIVIKGERLERLRRC